MEIVLLWFDDLEDRVHATAFALVRSRRFYLELGLLAALALVLVTSSRAAAGAAVCLAGVASASVLAWAVALVADRLVHEPPRPRGTA